MCPAKSFESVQEFFYFIQVTGDYQTNEWHLAGKELAWENHHILLCKK